MKDTLNSGETLVNRFLRLKTIDDITSALCDFHYIYGEDRSYFLAYWNLNLREAVVNLAEGRDEQMIHISRVIKNMLLDASESSAWRYHDKYGIIEGIMEAALEAYKRHKRNIFKASLSGNCRVCYDW